MRRTRFLPTLAIVVFCHGFAHAQDITSSILQRAVIPNNFYDDGNYFPQKNVANNIAKQSLTSSLFVADDTTGVRISNCLNKVHQPRC